MRRSARIAIVLSLLGALIASGSHNAEAKKKPLPTVFLGCDTIWGDDPGEGSFRLGNNLQCTTPFLDIAGDGITVDLGGHRVAGNNTQNGLRIFDQKNVTVRNGVLDGWDFTVIMARNENIRIENLVLKSGNTSNPGLEVQEDNLGIRITGNTLIDDTSINLSQDATGVVVSGNTLVRSRIGVQGSGNTISNNRIYGGVGPGIGISDGSERNKVVGNKVLGTDTDGIALTGNDADDNVIQGNTVRGHLEPGMAGISITDGDRTRILSNTVTANKNGIMQSGTAEDTLISGNNVSANDTTGIDLFSGDARITSNTTSENGGVGIQGQVGTTAVISSNTVNFNGYAQGIDDLIVGTIAGGIVASGATGSGNKARGNDVPATSSQCSPDLCDDGPPDPPPLTTCGLNVTASRTLRNPLVCDSTDRAIRLDGTGITVNLGSHVLTAGNAVNEAAVLLAPGASRIRINGGVLMNSEVGVFGPSVNPAKQVSVVGSTILRNDNEGVFLQGLDPTPADDVVEAGRNRVESSTIADNGAAGVFLSQGPANIVRRNTLAGNGAGVDLSQTFGNLIESNTMIGNGIGIDVSNDGNATLLPIKETIRRNRIIGSDAQGISANNAVENSISSNTIQGNGTVGQAGILLTGTGSPGGSLDNAISKNTVTGGAGDGITLNGDSSENRLTSNTVRANDNNGIRLGTDTDANRLTSNKVDENGSDGIIIIGPVLPSEIPDVLTKNSANRNGFLGTTVGPNTGDDVGFGIDIASDTDGSRNRASGNDHPFQCNPNAFC
jgi:parallel beta-helix repeat protein